ncbi:hypothetical protein L1887_07746 [Cichorium endivia]|nr:hypothetical protein L1887_07746 [Cichorium endivia]
MFADMRYKDKNDHVDIPGYGAIFMSNTGTKKECFQRKLLGLPLAQSNFVLHVKKGMILFLFEFEKRQLHGVFRATSNGEIDIEPNAFKSSGKRFPAQVCFTHVWKCNPLAEYEFMDAIRDNYFSGKKFKFGLSKDQVYKLITLFHSKRIPKKPTEGDSRFGGNRKNIRDRIRFIEEEDEVKEVDDHGYRTLMDERKQKVNRKRFLTNYISQEDDFGKISVVARNEENFQMDKNKYFRDDNRIQDDYHSPHNLGRGSQNQMIDDGGYFGHETVESQQRTLTEHPLSKPIGTTDVWINPSYDPRRSNEHPPYEPIGTDLSHFNQNNSDFIPIPEVTEQYQHPFEFNNIEDKYERGFPYSTSCDPSLITIHTPYDPEVPDFIHKPYDPEVPEFCHKSSYFAPGPGSSPVYPNETIPYHSQNKHSELGKLRSKHVRKVSVFDRLTKAPEVQKHKQEVESDEKDDLDASVNKVMKMLEKIVSSPIKTTRKRKSSFKQDDDDKITLGKIKIVDYELPNIESDEYEGIEGDESVIEETRVVDFKRRKKKNKNLDDESKVGGTESDVGKRRKLIRPVFVKNDTSLKVDCYLAKSVSQKSSIEGEVCKRVENNVNVENCQVLKEQPQEKHDFDDVARVQGEVSSQVEENVNVENCQILEKHGLDDVARVEGEVSSKGEENVNVENCKVVEEQPQEKHGLDDVARVESLKAEKKMCGWIEG